MVIILHDWAHYHLLFSCIMEWFPIDQGFDRSLQPWQLNLSSLHCFHTLVSIIHLHIKFTIFLNAGKYWTIPIKPEVISFNTGLEACHRNWYENIISEFDHLYRNANISQSFTNQFHAFIKSLLTIYRNLIDLQSIHELRCYINLESCKYAYY